MNGLRLTVALLLAPVLTPAQQPDPRVRTVQVTAGVYMLQGNGGNVGVGVGEEGVFVIDDQFAPMVGQIKAAVAALTDQEIRFVVNTHWHGDHTGGNERFGKAGAVILAHENVRRRMSVEQFMAAMNRRVPPSPPAALPVVTFPQDVTLHWGGDDVRIFHVEHAHTDGDSIVRFQKANVFHMGDVFFQSGYPFVDLGSGGSLPGLIAAVERVLSLADDASRIIPGHGDLTDKAGLREYHAMLTKVRDRVTDLVVKGHVADEVVAAAPSRELDERWGRGFIPPERFVRMVYAEVVRVRHAGDAPVPRVLVQGSDLMLELGQAWAAGFAATPAPRPEVAVAGGGTGAGLAALLAGEAHVALTSREPRDAELAAAADQGVALRAVPVAGRDDGARVYVAFRADLPAEARALVDWIGSPAGQEVTRAAGFVPAGAAR